MHSRGGSSPQFFIFPVTAKTDAIDAEVIAMTTAGIPWTLRKVAEERLRPRLLVVALPHSNARYAVAGMSQRAERVCAGLVQGAVDAGKRRSLTTPRARGAGQRRQPEAGRASC